MSWAVLTTAPDQITAEMWCDLLRQAGVTAIISPQQVTSFLGVSAFPCTIEVPQDQVTEARALLEEQIGGFDLEGGRS